jgi:hypothetical protein
MEVNPDHGSTDLEMIHFKIRYIIDITEKGEASWKHIRGGRQDGL